MSKPKRGKSVRSISNWRGTCPLCNRTGVKLLWEKTGNDSIKHKVCKACGN